VLIAEQILYEDNHLLIVNKPNGVLSQGDKTKDPTIIDMAKAYIKEKYDKEGEVFLHPVSRIDRPVSGALVLARTSKALSRMTQLIKQREIDKFYVALVKRRPKEEQAELIHHLSKDTRINKVKAFVKPKSYTKEARLSYKLIYHSKYLNVLTVQLFTGRPHQIRVQLAAIHCPIIGDSKYGYKEGKKQDFIYLHCRKLSFIHPVKKERLIIVAPFPAKRLWDEINNVEI